MKAMIINAFDDSDVFEQVEVAKPRVSSGQVLVKIAASSVNTVDMMIRQMGTDLPFAPALPAILGMDFAGTIEAVADDVTKFKVGDDVYGCAGGLGELTGSLAEYMAADVNLIALKPKSISMQQAAAIPLVGITAYEGLTRAGIQQHQKVLVHGGAGGVGHVALQLAKAFGAKVYATGSGEQKLSLIESLGAKAINYRSETVADYVEKYTDNAGFDIVFDSVGGENIAASFEAAALNGQVATTVSLLEMDLSTAHLKGLSLHVVFMLIPMIHNHQRQQHGKILSLLAELVDAGKLQPILDEQVFALNDVAKAHDRLASGKAIGKVVVVN